MKSAILLASLMLACSTLHSEQVPQRVSLYRDIPIGLSGERDANPLIDARGFTKVSRESAEQIGSRSLTEKEFLKAASEEGVIILDARSADRFAMRHIVGAKNLPFTDFTAATLAALIPSKETKVLIYCNNNFQGDQAAFATKIASTSLNLHTASSLRSYGYKNVYQLGPLINLNKTEIPFEGAGVVKNMEWLRSLASGR